MKIEFANKTTESMSNRIIKVFDTTYESMTKPTVGSDSKQEDMKKVCSKVHDRLLNFDKESICSGIIWAEILGRPKGLRRR